MQLWFGLLIGSVAVGVATVAVLVLPQRLVPFAIVSGLGGVYLSLVEFGAIATRYESSDAIAGATATLILASIAGYGLASALLPYLARLPFRQHALLGSPGARPDEAIVLMCCADAERYSPRAVSIRQNALAETAEVQLAPSAMPFVYLAEKSRYRAVGWTAPGAAAARRLASTLNDAGERTEIAWCHAPESLAHVATRLADEGVRRVAIVVLGPADSALLDAAREHLHAHVGSGRNGDPSSRLTFAFAAPVWHDRDLPGLLAERALAVAGDTDVADVGVVIVEQGAPPLWARRYGAAGETENYFDQRTRMSLAEHGIREPHLRIAWLDWQSPDVTEGVRHLAALGCTRIVVAPGTLALPTLETILDLEHEIALARVPENVTVVSLPTWGEQERFADTVLRVAREALAGEH